MGRGQFIRRNSQRLRRELRAVELRRVPQNGVQTFASHVRTNPFDNFRRRERLAKYLDGLPPPGFAYHVAARCQLRAVVRSPLCVGFRVYQFVESGAAYETGEPRRFRLRTYRTIAGGLPLNSR